MANDWQLDLTPLKAAVEKSPRLAGEGATQALGEIKDDWVSEARDIAPLDGSNLRKQIKGRLDAEGLDGNVMVTANATNKSKGYGRFNYAYYIHEKDAGGGQLQTPGTEKKFLDKSTDESRWQKILESRVLEKLRKVGWGN